MTAVRCLDIPPIERTNLFYVSNRPPLKSNPLIKLPLGTVKPEGWILNQLTLMASGLTGRITEVSPWCRFEESAWANPEGEGDWWWEELPYWFRGFHDLGRILDDKRILDESGKWMERVLSSQEADGYFGTRENKRNHDLWPNMMMLYALRSYFEATGDERVIRLMTRYFSWQMQLPLEFLLPESWQKWRGGDQLDSIYWLYNRTGESWLLDLARITHERTADWTGGIPTWHGVNICQAFREPAQYYQQTGDDRYLAATERNYMQVMGTYGQVPGGMFGADENCREGHIDPRQAAETCSIVEFMHSNEILLSLTGDPKYADRCEEIALNSFPASMTPDLKGLHYLTAPNMIQLDQGDKAPALQNSGTMLSYDPFGYRCCQHNVSHGWPYYLEHLWMGTHGNGLAAVLYGPCTVKAKVGDGTTVCISENTEYPFAEIIDLRFALPNSVEFPLLLRVPRWCDSPKLCINGESIDASAKPTSYLSIERIWNDGDVVRLELPMKLRVRKWANNANSVSIEYGPLTYSLKIGEKWVRYGGTDKWPAFEVYPTSPWNYGLVIDPQNPMASFEVSRKKSPIAHQPFTLENAPMEISTKGKRIADWKAENGITPILPKSPVRSDEPIERIILVPMGTARLRISSFPLIAEG